ncbi:hypothetical protein, partial [Seonamhaeicola maritimus]|uniref:hypothetical protein n=1 Tax=Seonamhaeicola maritimus TaxID=2591822 RepID=UPI0024949E24
MGLGNGPDPCKAKTYCSNSGAVESGLINCTTAADTDGCGIDASHDVSVVSNYVGTDLIPGRGITYDHLFSEATCQTKQYLQWIVFATPPTVKGTKIQAVGASDSWFLFHAGSFKIDPNADDTNGNGIYTSVLAAVSDPARCGNLVPEDLVSCSDVNQYEAWSNEDAVIGDDIYNIYFIGLAYDRPTNGSLNFKVKECEIGCMPEAVCKLNDVNLVCAADYPDALTNPADAFTITEDCGQEVTMSSIDSSESIDNDASDATKVVKFITRTYTLFINGVEVAQCVQKISNTFGLPTLISGEDLKPSDFGLDLTSCKPDGNLGITTVTNLFQDCLGNAINNNDLLVETVLISGDDCSWTANVKVTVTPANGNGPILIKDETFNGGDTTPPVIVQASGQANGHDFGCNSPTPPTFTATDNCLGDLGAVTPATNGPVADGCNMTQTWTANVSDGCNDAVPVSVTYTWKIDITAPVISVVTNSDPAGACNPGDIVPPTFSVEEGC